MITYAKAGETPVYWRWLSILDEKGKKVNNVVECDVTLGMCVVIEDGEQRTIEGKFRIYDERN